MRGTSIDSDRIWKQKALIHQTDGTQKLIPITENIKSYIDAQVKRAREEEIQRKMTIEFPAPAQPVTETANMLFTPPKRRKFQSISVSALKPAEVSTQASPANKPKLTSMIK